MVDMIAFTILVLPFIVLCAWLLLPTDIVNVRKLSKTQKLIKEHEEALLKNQLDDSEDAHTYRLTRENQIYRNFFVKMQNLHKFKKL